MAHFVDIKIVIMLIKTTTKDTMKVKRIKKKLSKRQFSSVFPDIAETINNW